MSAQTSPNKNLMRRVYEEMWNRSNPSAAAKIFEQPEGVERFVAEFLKSFPDLRHTVEEMIEEGDRVAVRFTARGTHAGQWMDFAATGLVIEYTGVTLARITGDEIIEHKTWWDKAELVEQISRGNHR